jgi:CNP1-like family
LRRALALLLVAVAACSSTPKSESEWEREHQQAPAAAADEQPAPPAYPRDADLLEFRVDDADRFRYFVDRTSVSVDKDGTVRYVLVARSPEGARNVTYEALRCASAENRVYAVGRADGTWLSAAGGGWRPIGAPRHLTLYRDYFCPHGNPVRRASDAVRALEKH